MVGLIIAEIVLALFIIYLIFNKNNASEECRECIGCEVGWCDEECGSEACKALKESVVNNRK